VNIAPGTNHRTRPQRATTDRFRECRRTDPGRTYARSPALPTTDGEKPAAKPGPTPRCERGPCDPWTQSVSMPGPGGSVGSIGMLPGLLKPVSERGVVGGDRDGTPGVPAEGLQQVLLWLKRAGTPVPGHLVVASEPGDLRGKGLLPPEGANIRGWVVVLLRGAGSAPDNVTRASVSRGSGGKHEPGRRAVRAPSIRRHEGRVLVSHSRSSMR